MRYMQFHQQGDFEGTLIEIDTIVSYEDAEAAIIDAAALYNSRPGESTRPVEAGNVDKSVLMTFAAARTLGVIPRQL